MRQFAGILALFAGLGLVAAEAGFPDVESPHDSLRMFLEQLSN